MTDKPHVKATPSDKEALSVLPACGLFPSLAQWCFVVLGGLIIGALLAMAMTVDFSKVFIP